MRTLLDRSSWYENVDQQAHPQDENAALTRTDLWLAVDLPELDLECSGHDYQNSAFVVLEEIAGMHYVHNASKLARQKGISRGMTINAALAVCETLKSSNIDPVTQQDKLQELVTDSMQLSSRVSIAPPTSFLLEVAGSIRYFGSLELIQQKLAQSLKKKLSSTFNTVVSPVPAASLLLARSGYESIIHGLDELRSVSGDLPVNALPIDDKSLSQLDKIGVRVLRDLWRLPVNELARRFDADFVSYLEILLGKKQELLSPHHPAPRFNKRFSFMRDIKQNHRLLPHIDNLLNELIVFLRHYDFYTNHFLIYLEHRQRDTTVMNFFLRQPSRDKQYFLKLVETDLEQRQLPGPVIGLELLAEEFHEFHSKTRELFRHDPRSSHDEEDIQGLLDQLRVRLGQENISHLSCCADHRPEYAGLLHQQPAGSSTIAIRKRPLWLLPEPQLLRQKTNRLYYKGPVHICSGPERIETGWWDGQDIRRDYYTAIDELAGGLWIYRDLKSESCWYLHGLFG